jgi:shikimate dehydrogenase
LDLFAGRFSKDKDVMARPLTPISLPEALQDTDLLINATPVGMAHSVQKTFFTEGIQIPKKLNYIDLIYQPSITPMMAQVRAAGGKAWNGLEMLINQAAASYQIWTGMHAPIDIMKAAVLRRMNE